ncbi:very short patch repair endonuclease [Janibacter indicus]|uniref:very short patch repair endonuclease n=1 Tax=Janibacter indicus TaxID=857417 RepID=UPI001F2092A9|nr:very short patch repair endonuclease [Janibacter indicus]
MSTEKREPVRSAPTADLSARFSRQRREGTSPELALRHELHRRGFRYRVQFKVDGLPRRRVDIAFPKRQLAVFVDGCFWHGCPEHCVIPKSNRDWWLWKFDVNARRDADTDRRLVDLGWSVARVWEHVDVQEAADTVEAALQG